MRPSVYSSPDAHPQVIHGRVWAIVESDVGHPSLPLWRNLYARYGKAPRLAGWLEIACPDCDDYWYFLVYLFEDAFEPGFLHVRNKNALENVCRAKVWEWIRKNPARVPARRGFTCKTMHEPIEIVVRGSRRTPLIRLSRTYELEY